MKIPVMTLAAASFLACAGPRPKPAPTAPTPEAPRTLYQRLGGQAAVEAVVGQFLANVAADRRINYFFGMSDLGRLRRQLADFVCAATDGPCRYQGRDMRSVHRGMGVNGAQFDALVDDLARALDQFHVPAREKGELLAALGPLRPDVVEVH
ncbi:MAG: group I truncated hemoglobin [Myxococcales bacterium]